MSRRHEPEPVATIDDSAATQHQQVVQAAAIARAARLTCEAIEAGMPVESARKWPAYVALKQSRGEVPISLAEAVLQCNNAKALPRIRKALS